MDNIFIERLWRLLKYEAVYLHELTDGFAAQRAIANWLHFYDTQRPHSALADSTPAEAYERVRWSWFVGQDGGGVEVYSGPRCAGTPCRWRRKSP